ncbi:MAG: DNA polymerase III subunit gamma/tau [Xanthomonadaceae bacterium]|nr:DNA polymerase III subunit gamma/tau [Xanthomonadaceae bacterium]
MSYQVLARKWRPRRFAELVGQEHVVRALSNALESGRMHHAYLFTGTRGVGKTTIARIFAKSLNCERGQSANPCGECAVCTAVDAGRFVDLLEIDAASNTGVDDVREVIENAQYAPTRGRYKVYLVDEVHMLSKNAFNALLKTLEEPPPHVKFLLATTDPQKLPVTVLSRCLKFNLKRLLPAQIVAQMRHILDAEGIAFEADAIAELARAADGSLRDGLSLLDQAIAYGGGAVRAADVRAMLGSIAQGEVGALLEALAAGDGTALLAEAARIAGFSPDFAGVLDQLAGALHRIQLRQLVPGFHAEGEDADPVADALAARFAPEDVQLYYQMAATGRRDLNLAPDARTGFEMTLLRMLAFRPAEGGAAAPVASPGRSAGAAPAPAGGAGAAANGARTASAAPMPPSSPARERTATPPPAAPAPVPLAANGLPDWGELIAAAGLGGPLGELARHAALKSIEGDVMTLALRPEHEHFAAGSMIAQLERRVAAALGRAIRVRLIAATDVADTPAERAERVRSAEFAAAEQALNDDPVVQALQREFDARVVPQSIRPMDS